MTKIRSDEDGLFVVADTMVFRPGSVRGCGHAMRMDDGGLVAGDNAYVKRVGTSGGVARVKLSDGTCTYWHHDTEDRRAKLQPHPDCVWTARGYRDFDVVKPQTAQQPTPQIIMKKLFA